MRAILSLAVASACLAIPACSRAPKFAAPKFVDCYERGCAWYAKGDFDKSIAAFNQALRLNPNHEPAYNAYNSRGSAWYAKGEYGEATKDYDQALKLWPDHAAAYTNLAWLQATCPDERYRNGKTAIVNATQALNRGGEDFWSTQVLAAAYAEDGQFDKAVEWQTKAIELTAKDKSASDKRKQKLRTRLDLYKQNKPYRDEPKKP
ncbi:MAG: tetratricopeptide repeat protein [Planctomycetota bacterium]|nr:tetratricopeptide repeat protein [Planctomycetota bacterium]